MRKSSWILDNTLIAGGSRDAAFLGFGLEAEGQDEARLEGCKHTGEVTHFVNRDK